MQCIPSFRLSFVFARRLRGEISPAIAAAAAEQQLLSLSGAIRDENFVLFGLLLLPSFSSTDSSSESPHKAQSPLSLSNEVYKLDGAGGMTDMATWLALCPPRCGPSSSPTDESAVEGQIRRRQ